MKNTSNLPFSPSCIDCKTSGCASGSKDYPAFCETALLSEAVAGAIRKEYLSSPTQSLMNAASDTARLALDNHWCRVEEIVDFAHRIGVKKLGVALCSGMMNEGHTLARILRAQEFEVCGIACKVGGIKRADLGIADSCCDYGSVSCNPLLQARLLNEAKTDLNIVLGLCVGHDIIFNQHSEAPCTTLVVKDRALVHNPAAALYAANSASAYNRMLKRNSV